MECRRGAERHTLTMSLDDCVTLAGMLRPDGWECLIVEQAVCA